MKRKNFIVGTSSKVKPSADMSFLSLTCGNSLCGAVDLPEGAEAEQENRECGGAPDGGDLSCADGF
ncbi:hypothetical protein [Pseudarthrobacter sp. H2]|uniref:hypothetical protein n=1 Tax=Pseudarthrobacter sp. H2 TaxID=3418415 RepID=UPI003CF73D71